MKRNAWLGVVVVALLWAAPAAHGFEYVVRPGDTLARLAERFGVTVAALQHANGLSDDIIYVGERLEIPEAEAREYVVRSGDTLAEIADRFGVSVAALRAANGISGSLIHPGQRLTIPGGSAAPAPDDDDAAAAPREHVVRSGDTLSRIADRYGVSLSALLAENGLTASTVIHPGQRLSIPGGAASPGPGLARVVAPMDVPASHVEVLARIVKGECPPQMPFEGKVAVAAVVLNRVRSRYFPDTIPGVAHQPMQFSCYNPGERDRLYWGPIPQYAWDAARAALAGADPTDNCEFYFNPYLVQPSWADDLVFVRRIGDTSLTAHDFYRRPSARPHTATSVAASSPGAAGALGGAFGN